MWFSIISLGYTGHEQERTKKCFYHLHYIQTKIIFMQPDSCLVTFSRGSLPSSLSIILYFLKWFCCCYKTIRLTDSNFHQRGGRIENRNFKGNSGTGLTHVSTPQWCKTQEHFVKRMVFSLGLWRRKTSGLSTQYFLHPQLHRSSSVPHLIAIIFQDSYYLFQLLSIII